jgi:hypothetical protein
MRRLRSTAFSSWWRTSAARKVQGARRSSLRPHPLEGRAGTVARPRFTPGILGVRWPAVRRAFACADSLVSQTDLSQFDCTLLNYCCAFVQGAQKVAHLSVDRVQSRLNLSKRMIACPLAEPLPDECQDERRS